MAIEPARRNTQDPRSLRCREELVVSVLLILVFGSLHLEGQESSYENALDEHIAGKQCGRHGEREAAHLSRLGGDGV